MLTSHAPKGGKRGECSHSDKNTALFAPVLNAAQLVRHVKCLKKEEERERQEWKMEEGRAESLGLLSPGQEGSTQACLQKGKQVAC